LIGRRRRLLRTVSRHRTGAAIAAADPIAYSSGVTLSGFAALAAPIFDEAQRLRYALTLIYRTDRHHKKKEELQRLTLEAANRASHLAGASVR
jgi:DNA-binding IclR family transcriptional regulator